MQTSGFLDRVNPFLYKELRVITMILPLSVNIRNLSEVLTLLFNNSSLGIHTHKPGCFCQREKKTVRTTMMMMIDSSGHCVCGVFSQANADICCTRASRAKKKKKKLLLLAALLSAQSLQYSPILSLQTAC